MVLETIKIIALIGYLLSIYSFYIEKKIEESKNYKAICDINEQFSCTKAFSSKYGHIMGVSNSLLGLIFYPLVFILAGFGLTSIMFYITIPSILTSLYLAYISYFKLKNLCIICTGIYIINLLLFIFSYLAL